MVDQDRAAAALGAIDEQLADFDLMVKENTPDRISRWQRITAEVLANHLSPEDANDFERAGRLTHMPAFGQVISPFERPLRQRELLRNLREDVARSPAKYLRAT